ncbi:MAG: hypothetical protein U0667_17550 [Chloroflexota bacterium]
MFSPLLPTADHIDRWAEIRTGAETALPRLVRRLITATTDPRWIAMPAGAAVRFPGWDGEVGVAAGNSWVPAGASFWEMGTNADPRDKAQRDYRKRTDETPEAVRRRSTFVFVSSRHWRDRDRWLADRRSDGEWAQVCAWNASDLEAWLEIAPHVHLWLSQEIDSRIVDARSLEDWYDQWADLSRPHKLPREMLLRGREPEARLLLEWLEADPRRHLLQGSTTDEVVAFVAAALMGPDADTNARLLRSVVVKTEDAWQRITLLPQALILLPSFPDPWIGRAVENGHHVIVPVGPDEQNVPEASLRERTVDELVEVLTGMGIDTGLATEVVTMANGSLLALRRRLSQVEEFRRPAWTEAAMAQVLTSTLLAGSWDGGLAGDRHIVASLAKREYDGLEADLSQLSEDADAPVRRRGSVWVVVDKRDLWPLLRDAVTDEVLDDFAAAAQEVLGARDPGLDLPPSERWMANVAGKARPHSERIRDGFATTLAMLGGWDPLRDLGGVRQGPEFAARVARQLLGSANADAGGGGWVSLGSVLPLIAEAAPFPFIDAVRTGLLGNEPPLRGLLIQAESGGVFGSAPHAPVLWGLEALAWNPDLLADVAGVLRDWTAIDPGGRWSNRPANSFREIFLPWHPQTSATVAQRIAALHSVRAGDADRAWPLLRGLLPTPNDFTGETARPRWRPWAVSGSPETTRTSYVAFVTEVLGWLLEDAGTNGARWASLLQAYDDLPEPLGDRVVAALAALPAEALDDGERELISGTVRQLVSRSRAYPEAQWALPARRLAPLDQLIPRFRPADPAQRVRWLFSLHPDIAAISGADYHRYEETLARRRLEALAELDEEAGWGAILRLIDQAEQPEAAGWTLGSSPLWSRVDLVAWLTAASPARARAADGFIRGRQRTAGLGWLEAWLDAHREDLDDDAVTRALLAAIPERRVWEVASSRGEDVEHAYWASFSGYPSGADVWYAASKLTEVGRPYEALDLLGGAVERGDHEFDAELVLRALDTAVMTQTAPPRHVVSMFTHLLPKLLDRLEAAGVATVALAQYEWVYLALFDDREHAPRRLSEALAADPAFFVQVVSTAFRGASDAPKPMDDAAAGRARQAYRLLSLWRTCPGASRDGLDPAELAAWVAEARQQLAAAERIAIGDELIGQILWWSPADPDGVHPHRAARQLIESLASDDVDRGFAVAAVNSRGVHFRSSRNGDDERALAAEYLGRAHLLREEWPRTAAILDSVAASYEHEGRRHDDEAALEELDTAERG